MPQAISQSSTDKKKADPKRGPVWTAAVSRTRQAEPVTSAILATQWDVPGKGTHTILLGNSLRSPMGARAQATVQTSPARCSVGVKNYKLVVKDKVAFATALR